MFRSITKSKRLLRSKPNPISQYNSALADKIENWPFTFQQGIVDDITTNRRQRIPTDDAIDLSSTVCAGISYWTGLSLLGIESRNATEFITDIYDPAKKIKHTLGVDHIAFIKHLASTNKNFYGLTVNPFRNQDPKKFRSYKGYAGEEATKFFDDCYKSIKDTSSALKCILNNGGVGVVSIQATFNNYSPNFHDILVMGYSNSTKQFLIFDPDARAHYNTQKLRPGNLQPLHKKAGLYFIDELYMNEHTHRQKPSPGGVTIGLFAKST